jgi:predicted RNA binding protein YcfA (HicA-like mRNA interferase family)
MERDSRRLIKLLEADGWVQIGVTGSHHHFKHPAKPGKVTIPHPRKDIPTGTVRALLRQAGLLDKSR